MIRYYVHGDMTDDGTKYYCLRCDAFLPLDHYYDNYNGHHNEYQSYLESLKSWQKNYKKELGYFRPNDAANWIK